MQTAAVTVFQDTMIITLGLDVTKGFVVIHSGWLTALDR